MGLASKVYRRPGTSNWQVRQTIPLDVRHAFKPPFDRRISLRTADASEARRLAAPIIERLETEIADARSKPSRMTALTLERGLAAVETWKAAGADPTWFRRCAINTPPVETLRLMDRPWEAIPDFEELLNEVLDGAGLEPLQPGASVVGLAEPLSRAFAAAHLEIVEAQWRAHALRHEAPLAKAAKRLVQATGLAATSELTLNGLLERFIASERPTDEDRVRNYVRRLVEELGDIRISDVTSDAVHAFLTRLRGFPQVKNQSWKSLTFGEIISRFEDDEDVPRLAGRTIRISWAGAYNRLFKFAVRLDLLQRNPVQPVIPAKKHDGASERAPYTADELKTLFSKPLFIGSTGEAHGYRRDPGSIVVRDAKFWLPRLALWSGMRLTEMTDIRLSDVREEDGVTVVDLTGRKLKTPQSRRLVPLHSRLLNDGLRAYVAELRERGEEWLFPDLMHDAPGSSSKQFGKWWALWMTANGFDNPALTFHSFRHTFKRGLREAGVTEEISDLLTGHKGAENVGRGYGRGVSLAVLSDALERLRFA